MNFREIRFGKASAEAESATAPELLIDGYLDSQGLTERAILGGDFLFLGYKGSGKTALAEHLKLRSDREPNLFVRHIFLSAFPYRSFQKIVSGSAEPETRFPTAWSWLLLILVLNSLLADQGLNPESRQDFEKATKALQKIGLLPARSVHDLVVASTKRSLKVSLPFDFGVDYESSVSGEDVRFLHLVDSLRQTVKSVRSSSRHLVIIDGLDDILTEREVQYQSLAALVTESMRLNGELTSSGAPVKLIVMCRTDLYERLPGPNKNKVRQDFATEFDWYHDPRDPSSSRLVILANLRARLAFPSLADVFHQFFPAHVDSSGIIEYLLVHTRHTPRDFLQLLGHLQEYWNGGRFTRDQILSGIRDYSIYYFLPEIKDELVGYISTEHTEAMLRLLASLGKRDFTLSELEDAARGKDRYSGLEIERACEIMYECSAIGHIDRRPSGGNHFSFKFRNRHSAFNPGRRILLHRGIWKAMNLI